MYMENHPGATSRGRTLGLIALAMLVALVAAVSSSSAQSTTSTTSTTAPAAAAQSVDGTPVQQTTPADPPAGSDRPDKDDCPQDASGGGPGDGAQGDSGGSDAPATTTPAPAL
jgi:hypothetical protein